MSLAKFDGDKPNLFQTHYNHDDCEIGLVHIGYGAFHRAHQAIYIDDYMQKTNDLMWGIAAVNLRPEESESFNLSSQNTDGYLIKTIDPNGLVEYRKVRSHLKFLNWAQASDNAENILSKTSVHAITITVTESGYYLDAEGNLDLSESVISDAINGKQGKSVYAYLSAALHKRMVSIDQPITILCCDNIRSNGTMLRKNLLAYLKATHQNDLFNWVSKKASFPSSMVDRITPRASLDLQNEIKNTFEGKHLDPIHSEAFSQWVVEDNFAGHMPDLSQSGAEITSDVTPYEEAKIRILNGGHTSLAYLGALAGYVTFDEVMFNPELRGHFDNFQNREVLPGLSIEVPFDKYAYMESIANRFCNSAIADKLERICMDGYSKMQLYIKPTLEACYKQNINPTHSLDVVASWYVYARRFEAGKMHIPYQEPYWEELSPLLGKGKEIDFATHENLWGTLPKTYDSFSTMLVDAIEKMEHQWPA